MAYFETEEWDLTFGRDIQNTTLRQIASLASSDATISYNTTNISDRVNEIHHMMTAMVPILTQFSVSPQPQQIMWNIPSQSRQSQVGLRSSPSEDISAPSSIHSICACKPRLRLLRSEHRVGPLIILRESKTKLCHSHECVYFIPIGSDESVGFKFRLGPCSRCWNVHAALNYNRILSTYSISTSLHFKANVPNNHPTFERMHELFRLWLPVEETLQSILKMFQEGKASPTDVNSDGNNLLHVSLNEYVCSVLLI